MYLILPWLADTIILNNFDRNLNYDHGKCRGWGLGLLTPNTALSSLYLHNAESKVKTIEVWPSWIWLRVFSLYNIPTIIRVNSASEEKRWRNDFKNTGLPVSVSLTSFVGLSCQIWFLASLASMCWQTSKNRIFSSQIQRFTPKLTHLSRLVPHWMGQIFLEKHSVC